MPRSKLTDRIPVVYVAGPYRGPTRECITLNINSARAIGLLTVRKGWSPVIPHANTGDLDLYAPDISDDFWLSATMELMRRCDAVVLVPGYENSVGTLAEMAEARRLGLPIYQNVSALPHGRHWLLEQVAAEPIPEVS